MKRFLMFCIALSLFIPLPIGADDITLDNPETLATPTSQNLKWYIDYISAEHKTLTVVYWWVDDNGNVIQTKSGRSPKLYWSCRDIEVPGENAECLDLADPFPCCTGAGTGTCDDMLDTCFSDVFGYVVDSENPMLPIAIGIGLRTLIWNQMKQDVLTPGNDGSFN